MKGEGLLGLSKLWKSIGRIWHQLTREPPAVGGFWRSGWMLAKWMAALLVGGEKVD